MNFINYYLFKEVTELLELFVSTQDQKFQTKRYNSKLLKNDPYEGPKSNSSLDPLENQATNNWINDWLNEFFPSLNFQEDWQQIAIKYKKHGINSAETIQQALNNFVMTLHTGQINNKLKEIPLEKQQIMNFLVVTLQNRMKNADTMLSRFNYPKKMKRSITSGGDIGWGTEGWEEERPPSKYDRKTTGPENKFGMLDMSHLPNKEKYQSFEDLDQHEFILKTLDMLEKMKYSETGELRRDDYIERINLAKRILKLHDYEQITDSPKPTLSTKEIIKLYRKAGKIISLPTARNVLVDIKTAMTTVSKEFGLEKQANAARRSDRKSPLSI